MNPKLFFSALCKFLLGVILVGLLLFLPAGSLTYTHGWLLLGILFIPMLLVGGILLWKRPSLLEKRLESKEPRRTQDVVVKLSGLMFLAGFITAGLGYRFGWYMLPRGVVLFGCILFLISYGLYALVLKQNPYLSRTIRVQEEQTVVETGLYALVRHPMYMATVLLFVSIPLVLGSVYALGIFLCYPVIIAVRIQNEEALLTKELPGYEAYKKKVKYRLIPFIW